MRNLTHSYGVFGLPKFAFSLIEILVTLIIISLLVSAFVPVVTKKLKSSDITVGSFGTAVASGECDQFSSEHHNCIMCTTNACSLCSSQMDLAAGQYVDPAISCDPKECTDFGKNCITCNKSGCSSCSTTSVSSGQYADIEDGCKIKNCSDKFGDYCTSCTKDTCTTYSCPLGYGFNSTTHECEKCLAGYYSPGGSAKCEKCETGKISSEGASSCSECSVASHKVANSTQTACVDKYCGANEYIDGVTCKSCPVGTYHTLTSASGDQNTDCTSCPTGCSACTSATKCTGCTGIYTLNSDGKCTTGCSPQTITLAGTTTRVTRFNMGDDPQCPRDVLASLSGVTFAPTGTKCSGNYCCWYGTTATCKDNSGGIYSSCNRTVCTYYAADKLCKSIGEGWKLPDSATTMANWYPANSTATTGLMLCSVGDRGTAASKCAGSGGCTGATNNNCRMHRVWTYKESGTSVSIRNLNAGGSWVVENNYPKSGAISVRCVKE